MNLILRTHHTTVAGDLREHAAEKLARLDRYLPRIGEVVVEVAHEETRSAAHRYTVQITLHAGGSILRAEERGADQRGAFDRAAEVVSRQARRHKQRLYERHRKSDPKAATDAIVNAPVALGPEEGDETEEYFAGKVVRVKHFEAKPMSQEEALAQMDLIGHDFFLFLDASTSEYALLYKRKDGDYGMLAPHRG